MLRYTNHDDRALEAFIGHLRHRGHVLPCWRPCLIDPLWLDGLEYSSTTRSLLLGFGRSCFWHPARGLRKVRSIERWLTSELHRLHRPVVPSFPEAAYASWLQELFQHFGFQRRLVGVYAATFAGIGHRLTAFSSLYARLRCLN